MQRRDAWVLFSAATAAALFMAAPAAAQEGNAEDGAEVFKKCRACHDVGPEAKNKVGPLLNDIIGRKAGTIEGFAYSEANKSAGGKGLVWTEDVLFKYLENPLALPDWAERAALTASRESDLPWLRRAARSARLTSTTVTPSAWR